MRLQRINDGLFLCLDPERSISFLESWVEQLRSLPYEKYGDFIRKNIYPALSLMERSLWNKATISNRVLQKAVEEFR